MKLELAIIFVGCLLITQLDALHVAKPRLVFGPDDSTLSQLWGGSNSDIILSPCRVVNATSLDGRETPLFKRKTDGTYQMLILPELQICPNSYRITITDGKWIFVSTYNAYPAVPAMYAIYSLDSTNSSLIEHVRSTNVMYSEYAEFTSENTIMGVFQDINNHQRIIAQFTYENGMWNQTLALPTQEINYTSTRNPLTPTSFAIPSSYIRDYTPYDTYMLLSQQKDSGEWMLSASVDSSSYWYPYYELPVQEPPLYWNGNTTVMYLGTGYYEMTLGTVYIAEHQKNNTWSVVKKFYAKDFGVENEYFYNFFSWAWSITWVNKDMALLMAPYFPLNFNATDYQYGGSVAVIHRDTNGTWHAGGRIDLDLGLNDEAVNLKYMTTTKWDIIIVGLVSDSFGQVKRSSLYSYPLCFPQPVNFTCLNDVQVPSCEEQDLEQFDTPIYQYVDDKCGEPMPTIANMSASNGKVTLDLTFERLGKRIGQCTASVVCPKPVEPPKAATSAVRRVVASAVLIFASLLVI